MAIILSFVIAFLLAAPLFLGTYVVAAFDAVRFGWSTMTPWLWPLGALHLA